MTDGSEKFKPITDDEIGNLAQWAQAPPPGLEDVAEVMGMLLRALFAAKRDGADAWATVDRLRNGDDMRAVRRLVFLLLVAALEEEHEHAAEIDDMIAKSLEWQSQAIALGERASEAGAELAKLRAEVESLKARLFAEETERTRLDAVLSRIGDFAVSREAREPRSFAMFGADEITGRDRKIDHLVASLALIAAMSRGEK